MAIPSKLPISNMVLMALFYHWHVDCDDSNDGVEDEEMHFHFLKKAPDSFVSRGYDIT